MPRRANGSISSARTRSHARGSLRRVGRKIVKRPVVRRDAVLLSGRCKPNLEGVRQESHRVLKIDGQAGWRRHDGDDRAERDHDSGGRSPVAAAGRWANIQYRAHLSVDTFVMVGDPQAQQEGMVGPLLGRHVPAVVPEVIAQQPGRNERCDKVGRKDPPRQRAAHDEQPRRSTAISTTSGSSASEKAGADQDWAVERSGHRLRRV